MASRMLQLIFGIVIFFCSMPRGMAQNTIPEEARACFFVSSYLTDDERQSATLGVSLFEWNDEAVLFEGETTSATSHEGKVKHQKRHSHRHNSTFGASGAEEAFRNNRLSFNSLKRGYPRHPRTQDAQEQRTKMIRFAQLAAEIC